jgi:hypothetical protein
MIFLVSSSGFLIYKSHCACSGNEQVSMFVNREICQSEKPVSVEEKTHMYCCSAQESQTVDEKVVCQKQVEACDCGQPEVTYLKLKNQAVNEGIKFIKVEPIELLVPFNAFLTDFIDCDNLAELLESCIEAPPLITSCHEFLIQIHQLKIPALA